MRHEDVSGVSGTGVVAEGCEFTDGSVALRWHGKNAATSVWPDLETLLAVHGHTGKTVISWFDAKTDNGRADPVNGRAQLGHLVPWRVARPVR